MLQTLPTIDLTRAYRPVREPVHIIACTLLNDESLRPWHAVLAGAGELAAGSQRLAAPAREVEDAWKASAEDPALYLMNFGTFCCSQRIERYARLSGYHPAHPRALAELAESLSDLPERLEARRPLSVASLVPCYRQDGETFVMSATWDKGLGKRRIRGVYYEYGWEPEYWLLFERESPLPVLTAAH